MSRRTRSADTYYKWFEAAKTAKEKLAAPNKYEALYNAVGEVLRTKMESQSRYAEAFERMRAAYCELDLALIRAREGKEAPPCPPEH